MSCPFSHEIKEEIRHDQNGLCFICDEKITGVHHKVPESLMGVSSRENGVGLCDAHHEIADRYALEEGITFEGPLNELPDKFFRSEYNPFKGKEFRHVEVRHHKEKKRHKSHKDKRYKHRHH